MALKTLEKTDKMEQELEMRRMVKRGLRDTFSLKVVSHNEMSL